MKLLIDANILLDVLQNREPHVQASFGNCVKQKKQKVMFQH